MALLDELTERLAEAEQASKELRKELGRLRAMISEARSNLLALSAEPRSFAPPPKPRRAGKVEKPPDPP